VSRSRYSRFMSVFNKADAIVRTDRSYWISPIDKAETSDMSYNLCALYYRFRTLPS
jgi:hypothetical protein